MKTLVSLSYGKKKLTVEVEKSNRSSLCIAVHPDLRVTAKAPVECGLGFIRRRLEKRASWIIRQIDFFERFHPLQPARKFVSGETHYFLGRQYRLRIRRGRPGRVLLLGRFFEMELPEPDNREKAKELMLGWYLSHATDLIERRFRGYWTVFMKLGAVEPRLVFRRMKRRWGSCGNGAVVFNTELIKAPLYCVDYVIVHELCHLLCPRHNEKFYRLLSRIMPDWKKRKERLEKAMVT